MLYRSYSPLKVRILINGISSSPCVEYESLSMLDSPAQFFILISGKIELQVLR